MKISIAMCTHNGSRFLREQLASLAAQSRLPDELVVADDASEDSTVQIVESFASSVDFPVRVEVNEKRLGTTKNFERAISRCDGDVIALADQDDVWLPHKLHTMEQVFAADADVGCVFSDARVVSDNLDASRGSLWERVGFTARERQMFAAGRALDVLTVHNVITGAALAFRSRYRDVLLPIPDESDMVHDRWIGFVLAACCRLQPIETPLLLYRQHEAQQIGAGMSRYRFVRWMEQARRTGRSDYRLWSRQLGLMLARLESIGDRLSPAVPGEIRGRIAHLEMRSGLPYARLRRVPAVLRELLALRYHRFSNGIWSALKDLVLS